MHVNQAWLGLVHGPVYPQGGRNAYLERWGGLDGGVQKLSGPTQQAVILVF